MRKLSFLIVMLLLVIGGIVAWWINGTMPANPSYHTTQLFVVKNGEGIREIANDLKAQGIIRDPVAFFLYVKQQKLDAKIQAGEFHLDPAMPATEIAKVLQKGTFDIRVTIPEGKRAEEIADILKQRVPGFTDNWRATLDANEGYLFPDTYSFPKDVTIDQVVATMRNNFDKKYASIRDGYKNTLPEQQIVTIASMVEREAKFPEDRPLVASVIYNRLHQDMPLQIDANIQYALGYQQNAHTWWKKDLTADDLTINSPYNSYKNTGLPPTPISNPGFAVLQAVITAPQTNYIYYVSDKDGHNHYATTLEEHNANIKKYGVQ